jgi:hypothetical protein
MNPKEKAILLIEDFHAPFGRTWPTMDGKDARIRWKHAKQSALICVEELIKSHSAIVVKYKIGKGDLRVIAGIEYWTEVKNEIEKL